MAGLQDILSQRFRVLSEKQRLRANARGGQRRFGAGVSAPDDNNIKISFGHFFLSESYQSKRLNGD